MPWTWTAFVMSCCEAMRKAAMARGVEFVEQPVKGFSMLGYPECRIILAPPIVCPSLDLEKESLPQFEQVWEVKQMSVYAVLRCSLKSSGSAALNNRWIIVITYRLK